MLADTAAAKRWLKQQQRRLLREAAYGFDIFYSEARGKAEPAAGQRLAARLRSDTR